MQALYTPWIPPNGAWPPGTFAGCDGCSLVMRSTRVLLHAEGELRQAPVRKIRPVIALSAVPGRKPNKILTSLVILIALGKLLAEGIARLISSFIHIDLPSTITVLFSIIPARAALGTGDLVVRGSHLWQIQPKPGSGARWRDTGRTDHHPRNRRLLSALLHLALVHPLGSPWAPSAELIASILRQKQGPFEVRPFALIAGGWSWAMPSRCSPFTWSFEKD